MSLAALRVDIKRNHFEANTMFKNKTLLPLSFTVSVARLFSKHLYMFLFITPNVFKANIRETYLRQRRVEN